MSVTVRSRVMAGFTLYHNPRCSKSRQALEAVEAAGALDDAEVVRYLEHPPAREELEAIVAKLVDEPARLVRRERWDELGVTAADVATSDGVVDVLSRHPQLMERPCIVTPDRAFIGRPTERVVEFLADR
jgi:arsenate reductase (glutaredoxin)